MMALATSMLPVSMANSSGELDRVHTWTLTSTVYACRGFWLIALMTMVEPLLTTRTRTLDMN